MKVVLDTNCFISCIGKKSPYRNVFDSFLSEKYVLCISTEMLLEYEEVFLEKWGIAVTQNLLSRLVRAKNVETVSVFFRFDAVQFDADDNKFADVYLASNADILVSNDHKLLQLNRREFPRFEVATLQEFSRQLLLNSWP
jgi:uncharacterized protein